MFSKYIFIVKFANKTSILQNKPGW